MDNKKNERPESYPRPTEKDNQLKNQAEFIDEGPNSFESSEVSKVATKGDEEERRGDSVG